MSARIMATDYLSCMLSTYFARLFRGSPLRYEMVRPFESISIQALKELNFWRRGSVGPYQRVFGQRGFDSCISELSKAFEDQDINLEHKFGTFSSLRTSELSLLASRNEKMVKRYGE